jgi:hypothetical protein
MGQGVVEIDGAEKHTDFFTEEGCFHSRRTGVLRPVTRHVYGSPSQSAHRSHAVANSQDLKLHLTPRIHSHSRLHLHTFLLSTHTTHTRHVRPRRIPRRWSRTGRRQSRRRRGRRSRRRRSWWSSWWWPWRSFYSPSGAAKEGEYPGSEQIHGQADYCQV